MEYAYVVWAPHTQRDTSSIESVHRHAARIISMITHSTLTLQKCYMPRLNWPSTVIMFEIV